jgi:hypothetical protein
MYVDMVRFARSSSSKVYVRFLKFCFLAEKINFFEIGSKWLKIALLFRDFGYRNLIFMQNKHDIRNQHKKLHRRTYILFKKYFSSKSDSYSSSARFYSILPCGP